MNTDWNLAVWPDGTWCWRDEVPEMSDDYQRLYWPDDGLSTISWLLDCAAIQFTGARK